MKSVYLAAAATEVWTPNSLLRVNSPYFRRMTALQKAVVQSFAALEGIAPEAMQKARAGEAPIFYSSAFGELSAMLHVTRSILDEDLPVSPKEFQHSVQNAALAYLAMTHSLHHPCYALSGGFLSADSCLRLAQDRIAYELDSMAFVIHAHEYLTDETATEARAEILLLTASPDAALSRLDFCRPGSLADLTQGTPEIFSEQDTRISPWLLHQSQPAAARLVRAQSGEILVTQWLFPQ